MDRDGDFSADTGAQVAELLASGPAATRRRRRTGVIGVVAAIALVLGIGGLTARVFGHGTDGSRAGSVPGDLTVRISYADGRSGGGDPNPFGASRDRAVWDPQTDVVYYASGIGYSGSCRPTGTARQGDAGSLTLKLVHYQGGGVCTADAVGVVAAIHGVTRLPTTLTVTELGDTRDVTVTTADANGTPADVRSTCGTFDLCRIAEAPADPFTLDCRQDHSFVQATFDFVDDSADVGTPEGAVTGMLAADERASAAQDVVPGKVRIALLRPEGTTRAVVTVERIHTGWRPSAIVSCPGEPPAGRRR